MHNHYSIYSSCLGLVEAEVGPHEGNIPDRVPEKEGDAVEVVHHIVGEVILGHVLEKESQLDAQHPVPGVVPIPDHLDQVQIHLHPNIDQKSGVHQVIQARSHDRLPKSDHVPNHLQPKMIKCPLVKSHQPMIDSYVPGLLPENLKILK